MVVNTSIQGTNGTSWTETVLTVGLDFPLVLTRAPTHHNAGIRKKNESRALLHFPIWKVI